MHNTRQTEPGRTLVETLGVLAIMALITIAGLKGFGWAHANAIANKLIEEVLDMVVLRQNDLLTAKNRDIPDKWGREAAHNTRVTVENGTDGNLKDVFWITLSTVNQNLCERILEKKDKLKEANMPLLAIAVGDNLLDQSQQLCQQQNDLKFVFSKDNSINASSNGDHDIIVTPSGCDARLCPTGATCTNTDITCQAGYHKVGCGTCDVTCKPCGDNEISSSASSTCGECTSCGPGQTTTDHKTCKNLPNGTPCTMIAGGTGYALDGDCVECTQPNHCGNCQTCTNNTCIDIDTTTPCDDCTGTKKCWDKDDKKCILCPGDCETTDDCLNGKTCDTATHTCTTKTCTTDTECDPCYTCTSGTCVEKTNCTPCPTGTECPEGQTCNTTTNECEPNIECDTNATKPDGVCLCNEGYYGDGKTCTKCPDGKTSPAGTQAVDGCACDEATSVWNEDEEYCLCKPGYAFDGSYSVCEKCPDNMTSEGGWEMCYCPDGFVTLYDDNATCALCPSDSTIATNISYGTVCKCNALNKMWNPYTNQCVQACDENAQTLFPTIPFGFISGQLCDCKPGFYGDGQTCTSCGPGNGWEGIALTQNQCICSMNSTPPRWGYNGTENYFNGCYICPENSTYINAILEENGVSYVGGCECTETGKTFIRSTNSCEACPESAREITLDDGGKICISLTKLNIPSITTSYYHASGFFTGNTAFTYAEADRICKAFGKEIFNPMCMPAIATSSESRLISTTAGFNYSNTYNNYCGSNAADVCTTAVYPCTGETLDSTTCQQVNQQTQWIKELTEQLPYVTVWGKSQWSCTSNKAFSLYPDNLSRPSGWGTEQSFGGYGFSVANDIPKTSKRSVICQ